MKVTVTRAFLLGGKRHEVGTSTEVSDSVGRELIAAGKAERTQTEPPAPPPGPLTTQTAAAVVKGKAQKESAHVG